MFNSTSLHGGLWPLQRPYVGGHAHRREKARIRNRNRLLEPGCRDLRIPAYSNSIDEKSGSPVGRDSPVAPAGQRSAPRRTQATPLADRACRDLRIRAHRKNRRGSSLLFVLAVMFILGLALTGLLAGLNSYIEIQANRHAGLRAYQMALSGLAFALEPDLPRDAEILNADFDGVEGYSVEISSENALLNLNSLLLGNKQEVLQRLFEFWGLDPMEAEILTDRMIDWVDGDSLQRLNGAEELQYRNAGRRGQPRNASFQSLDEVEQVLGMERLSEVQPNWRDAFTVEVNSQLNLLDARADVIAAYLDLPVDSVEQFVDYRNGPDRVKNSGDEPADITIEEALGIMGGSLAMPPEILSSVGTTSTHHRIISIGRAGNKTYRIAVIAPNSGNLRKNQLTWLEL